MFIHVFRVYAYSFHYFHHIGFISFFSIHIRLKWNEKCPVFLFLLLDTFNLYEPFESIIRIEMHPIAFVQVKIKRTIHKYVDTQKARDEKKPEIEWGIIKRQD